MTKVQLQNKESVTQLRLRFAQAVDDHANVQTTWTQQQKDEFVQHLGRVGDRAMELLQRNVQINGKDWDDYDDALDAVEPLDKALEEQLLELQVEVNQLLVDVAQCRNDVPPLIAQAVAARLAHAGTSQPVLAPADDGADQTAALLNDDERAQLHHNMDAAAQMLAALAKSLPQAVSRLQHAVDVDVDGAAAPAHA